MVDEANEAARFAIARGHPSKGGSMSRDTKKRAKMDPHANGSVGLLENGAPEANGAHGAMDEQIRLRAYELYLERGAQPNDDLADWLRAERELRERAAADLQGPPS
jgi:hypothetical protein